MAEIQQEMAADKERIEGTLEALQKTLRRKRRTFVELAAIATCLHNAYSGIENLLKRVLQHLNIPLPHTATPHKDLLNLAVEHKINPRSYPKRLMSIEYFATSLCMATGYS